MQLDTKALIEVASLLFALFGCTWHLSGKLTALTVNLANLTKAFELHVKADDDRFDGLHERVDRVTPAGRLHAVGD